MARPRRKRTLYQTTFDEVLPFGNCERCKRELCSRDSFVVNGLGQNFCIKCYDHLLTTKTFGKQYGENETRR